MVNKSGEHDHWLASLSPEDQPRGLRKAEEMEVTDEGVNGESWAKIAERYWRGDLSDEYNSTLDEPRQKGLLTSEGIITDVGKAWLVEQERAKRAVKKGVPAGVLPPSSEATRLIVGGAVYEKKGKRGTKDQEKERAKILEDVRYILFKQFQIPSECVRFGSVTDRKTAIVVSIYGKTGGNNKSNLLFRFVGDKNWVIGRINENKDDIIYQTSIFDPKVKRAKEELQFKETFVEDEEI